MSFTARIGRAQSHRAPSASKKDGLATPCPWADTDEYAAATAYRQQFRARYEREAQALATHTGWSIGDIRRTMNIETASAPIEKNCISACGITNEIAEVTGEEAGRPGPS